MNNKPLISVLMGIYNCADTLEKAVDCILKQTYSNLELIMCDDGSTDSTYEVAKKLAEKDDRILLLKNEINLTLAPTLNKCLSVAKGEYIARMDGDDTCSQDRLLEEIEFLENNKEYSIVSCNMNLSNSNGVFRIIVYKEKPELRDFLMTSQHCHAACMIRTKDLKDVNGYSENADRYGVEDYDLWVRMYAKGYKGYNIQLPMYTMLDSIGAQERRNFKRRINESKVMFEAHKYAKVNILSYSRCLIPIIKGIIPKSVFSLAHKNI